MYISGAKFEDHCSNISGDILNSVFYRFSGAIYDVITSLICIIQKREYLLNEKRYSKKENATLLYFEKPFKYAAIIFYFIGTLTHQMFSVLTAPEKLKNVTITGHFEFVFRIIMTPSFSKSADFRMFSV